MKYKLIHKCEVEFGDGTVVKQLVANTNSLMTTKIPVNQVLLKARVPTYY